MFDYKYSLIVVIVLLYLGFLHYAYPAIKNYMSRNNSLPKKDCCGVNLDNYYAFLIELLEDEKSKISVSDSILTIRYMKGDEKKNIKMLLPDYKITSCIRVSEPVTIYLCKRHSQLVMVFVNKWLKNNIDGYS